MYVICVCVCRSGGDQGIYTSEHKRHRYGLAPCQKILITLSLAPIVTPPQLFHNEASETLGERENLLLLGDLKVFWGLVSRPRRLKKEQGRDETLEIHGDDGSGRPKATAGEGLAFHKWPPHPQHDLDT